ncbi:MAG: hypothetical protein U0V02_00420 [Anaerolineales bacterium]
MKKVIPLIVLFLSLACATIIPTPNDFPPPPMTVIVELPNVTAVPTFELLPRPITSEKMLDAQTFFLILKTRALSGDDFGIAETVRYPLAVGANVIATTDEFVANYNEIFTDTVMAVLTNTSEEDLVLLPDGVRVGQGEIWFNLFCVDEACSDTQFLIIQINP